jgi:hypothetical protein
MEAASVIEGSRPQMSVMNHSAKIVLATLSIAVSLFGQSATPVVPTRTSRVQGEIRHFANGLAAGADVTFQGKKEVTVRTDGEGRYRADLPWGLYTMTVGYSGWAVPDYQRPLFRVASSTTIILNVVIHQPPPCEPTVSVEKPTLTEDDERNVCGGWDRFAVPSNDGIPFELLIFYPARQPAGGGYVYHGRHRGLIPVFVAYNLFTLEADEVTYDASTHVLEATGNVVSTDESGIEKKAELASFKIDGGRVSVLNLPPARN